MDIKKLLKQSTDLGYGAIAKAGGAISGGLGYVRQSVGGLALFGSAESSDSYEERVDEKHYFLVPYRLAASGYVLYSMRCLPLGVPPVNDLPKRRVFHLTDEASTAIVEDLLRQQARDETLQLPVEQGAIGSRLIDLADQLDRIDDKAFGGLLAVGAIAAVFNPALGVAIAAKLALPSIGMFLSKYGLKSAGEAANQRKAKKEIEAAEKEVIKQFRGSGTESLVNPVLRQLEQSLQTTEFQYDPIMDVRFDSAEFGGRDRQRHLQLTFRVITNVYEELLGNEKLWVQAHIGPEDVRWLQLIRELANQDTQS